MNLMELIYKSWSIYGNWNNLAWDWFVYHSVIVVSNSLSSGEFNEPPDKGNMLIVSSSSQYNLLCVLESAQ